MSVRLDSSLKLPDRFSLVRKLGQGGMGVVYEAIDRDRQSRVALKTLLNLHPVALYRFKNEFRTLANLSHANLIPLYELISDGNTWFFTMELVEGVDFLSFVREAADTSTASSMADDMTLADRLAPGMFREEALRTALQQLTEGILALHDRGILHRDVKPSNVLVRADGQLRLLDFGLAKLFAAGSAPAGGQDSNPDLANAGSEDATISANEIDEPHAALTGMRVVGSVGYMSPEQAAGAALTEASDWYAVGVMLYEALTGVRPFTGSSGEVLASKQTEDPVSPRHKGVQVPDDLANLAMALLQRNPRERPGGREILSRLSPSSESRPQIESLGSRGLPFVGREQQMADLQAALDELTRSRAVAVEVHGRSGAGKTTLVQHFLASLARQTDVVVLSGRCYEQESVPFKALDSLVDALYRYLASLRPVDASLLMPRDVKALARLFPVLDGVGAVQEASRGQRDIPDVQEVRRRGVRALAELLQRLGDRQLLVLSIDDLQWGDLDSAALLASLLQSADPPRLLMLTAYRSEYADRSECVAMIRRARAAQTEALAWREIEVAPLSLDESGVLVRELLGPGATASSDRVARIALESSGNPYFVYELVREVQARAGKEDSLGGVPRTLDLDEVLWRRVLELPEDAVRVLEVTAAAGKPLEQQHAFEASGVGQRPQAVALLRAERLVRTTGPALADEIETYHDRIRESVMAHLPGEVAREHYLALARVLETAGVSDVEWVASLFRQAGDLDRAGVHYLAAADKAAAALAFSRSARLYALSLETRPQQGAGARSILTKMADALANAGRGYEAAQAYERACEGADDRERIDLKRRAGFQYCVSGHIDEGRRAFSEVLAHDGQRLQPTRRRALTSLLLRRLRLELRGTQFRERDANAIPKDVLDRVDVSWSVAAGITIFDPIRGADFQTQNLLLALRAGEPFRIARALAWEGAHVGMVGVALKKRAHARLDVAESLTRRLNHPYATAITKLSRGVAAYFHGEFESCQRYSEEALELFRDHCTGVAWELETSIAFAHWSLYFRGEYAELTRRFPGLLAEARDRGARMAEADLITFGGPFFWLAADDPAGADQAVERVMGEWSRQDFQVQHFTTLTAQAQIAMYAGRYEAAWSLINQQWSGVKDAMLLYVELVNVYMLYLRARAAVAALDTTLDSAMLRRSAARDAVALSRLRPAHAQALAKLIRAALAHRERNGQAAIDLLTAGARELRELGWGAFSVPAERCLGQLIGGDEGRRLVAESEASLHAQGVRNIDRMVNLQVPGFGITSRP